MSLPIDDGRMTDESTALTLYRGLKLTQTEIDQYKSYLADTVEEEEFIQLCGF